MRVVAVVGLALLVGCAPTDEPSETPSGRLTVLAAASLTDAFDILAAVFERQHPGVDVVISTGGSSALAEQVLSGARADVFAAADEAPMATVADAGLAASDVVFATNTLTLVVPVGNPGGVAGLDDLADPALTVALCDPTVPCGAAAERLLAGEGVTASVDTFEEDVRAALTKVALGEVDAALVYRTDVAAAAGAAEGIAVPDAEAVVNRYPIAVLADAPNPTTARAFVEFVLSTAGREVLADAGFGIP